MSFDKDPIGYAINDFVENGFTENIQVKADLCEDDVLPPPYLFRTFEMMPDLEVKALEMCEGTILDVGAAAGCHSFVLNERGFDVTAIDISRGAVEHMKQLGINAYHQDFFLLKKQYNTLLILMNGVGIAGKLENLATFLQQIKLLLKPGGKAICDSTDLRYLYKEEDGSMWVDLNGAYYGEMQFKMSYKEVSTDWFDWLYIDFELLNDYAQKEGLNCELVFNGPSNNYLAVLTHQ